MLPTCINPTSSSFAGSSSAAIDIFTDALKVVNAQFKNLVRATGSPCSQDEAVLLSSCRHVSDQDWAHNHISHRNKCV